MTAVELTVGSYRNISIDNLRVVKETYVVDERYYDGNLVELVESRGITDVLIINNCAAANTNFHIANIESLLTQSYSGAIAYPEG